MSILATIFPGWAARRERQRASASQAKALRMHYEAAIGSRRTKAWPMSAGSADDVALAGRERLRNIARDTIRNNPVAAKAVAVIASNVIGGGIIPTVQTQGDKKKKLEALIKQHLETTSIDTLGKLNVYGIQALATRAIVTDGEVLLRRRLRMAKDKLPLPFQIEVLESDFIDTSVNGQQSDGTTVVQGIALSPIGRIEGYHLFDHHPGSSIFGMAKSRFVPAADVAHIYRVDRPGQVRGISWLAPILLRLRDLDDFKDAHLMRQKIAACFAAFIKTNDGGVNVDDLDDKTTSPPLEAVEPGIIEHLKPGEEVAFGTPPMVMDFDPYVKSHQRDIAAGLGISYEALTGDLGNVNFSSGRMGWLEFQRSIDAWRNYMLVPQACERIGTWFLEAAGVKAGVETEGVSIAWTAPRREMISPRDEIPAIRNAIRAGLTSRSEEMRKLGFDPVDLEDEIAGDNARADSKGLVFDSDARKTSGAGQQQAELATND